MQVRYQPPGQAGTVAPSPPSAARTGAAVAAAQTSCRKGIPTDQTTLTTRPLEVSNGEELEHVLASEDFRRVAAQRTRAAVLVLVDNQQCVHGCGEAAHMHTPVQSMSATCHQGATTRSG